ncbi:50S ribosomal protein L14 [Candidatus Bathyarchaeota archaeon ex4484_205]|nr:MAG: 50S ribosomal protein L14 [Candidatus Bathyarchaeota archaeon ex4484_205]RLG67397.1 MAG: 50S ribosomal protein L14 [archaeon]HDN17515.1 50S ribosomal protein L14 [Candidatus Bathyarchaeota archaeon]
MSVRSRAVSARGILEYRLRHARGLPVGSTLVCTDNSGAKELEIIQVHGYKGRLRRLPSANVGDLVSVTVKKGIPELRRQVFKAIIVRQRFPIRRPEGWRVVFEDNAAVLVLPTGDLKGTEIRGPVAREAADRWPRVAALASIII